MRASPRRPGVCRMADACPGHPGSHQCPQLLGICETPGRARRASLARGDASWGPLLRSPPSGVTLRPTRELHAHERRLGVHHDQQAQRAAAAELAATSNVGRKGKRWFAGGLRKNGGHASPTDRRAASLSPSKQPGTRAGTTQCSVVHPLACAQASTLDPRRVSPAPADLDPRRVSSPPPHRSVRALNGRPCGT